MISMKDFVNSRTIFWNTVVSYLCVLFQRSTDTMVCGKSVLVCGYGEVGKGIVSSLKSLGKKIIIEELHSANTYFYFNEIWHFVSYLLLFNNSKAHDCFMLWGCRNITVQYCIILNVALCFSKLEKEIGQIFEKWPQHLYSVRKSGNFYV